MVFSADAPMWGERGQMEGAQRSMYDMIAGNMMMYGIDLSAYMTYDDIACPKPMLFISGSQDKLFPVAGVEKAFSTMHDTWRSQGAGDKIETELWDMPHSCGLKSQARVLEFFDKHLKESPCQNPQLSPAERADFFSYDVMGSVLLY